MKYVKNQLYETFYKSSTIPKGTMASLGTIEADACSYYGRHDAQECRGQILLEKIIPNLNFESVLDIGSGEGKQKRIFEKMSKKVKTCDFVGFEDSVHCSNKEQGYDYVGDFNRLKIEEKFDFVFSSHVLEHQRNPGFFIDNKIKCCKDGGFICTIVPIRKPFIVGGHCSIWNAGLLLYHFVLAGIDCSESYVEQLDYEIILITKNKKFDLNSMELNYDMGDINKLMKYFPFELTEPFNGDIMKINTLWREE